MLPLILCISVAHFDEPTDFKPVWAHKPGLYIDDLDMLAVGNIGKDWGKMVTITYLRLSQG